MACNSKIRGHLFPITVYVHVNYSGHFMAKRRTLDDDLIRDIAIYREHGLSFRAIARKLGIPWSTFWCWLEAGRNATRINNNKKLWDMVGRADFNLVYDAAATVRQAATQERITKIQEKDTFDSEGNPITETTITKEGPSLQAALKILKLFAERWRGYHESIDMEDNQASVGYDPLADLVDDDNKK